VQINAPVGNRVAQQVAGDQQVAGKVICLALDVAQEVCTGEDAFFVTAEAGPLATVQDEVAKFMGDSETLTLGG
jgi:hypothetical protein